MAVSGLVITWTPDEARAAEGRRRLAAEPGCTPGAAAGLRQPVVLESASMAEAEAAFRRIGGWPGVAAVHVACVYFEDDGDGRG